MVSEMEKELAEALRAMQDHAITNVARWYGGGGCPSHPVWTQVAAALEHYEAQYEEQG